MQAAPATRYKTGRPFLALLGESKALDAARGEAWEVAAVQRLSALERRWVKDKPLLPREVDGKPVSAAGCEVPGCRGRSPRFPRPVSPSPADWTSPGKAGRLRWT